jgi:hypothetical protein
MEMCIQFYSPSGLTAWKASGSHLIGNWVDPEVGLELWKHRKSLLSGNPSRIPPLLLSYTSHCKEEIGEEKMR